jgi:hypothetical protein
MPEVMVDDQVLRPVGTRSGQTMLAGVTVLSKGKHTLTLRAHPDRDLRADFIILTNDQTVSGYDFYSKRPAFEAVSTAK